MNKKLTVRAISKTLIQTITAFLFLGLSSVLLTVSAAEVPVTELFWEIPTTKADGSPLDDLAGFRVRCTRNDTDPIPWGYVRDITNITTSTLLLTDLFSSPDATIIYCTHQSYNTVNDESFPSDVVTFRRLGAGQYVVDIIFLPPNKVQMGIR